MYLREQFTDAAKSAAMDLPGRRVRLADQLSDFSLRIVPVFSGDGSEIPEPEYSFVILR